MLITSQTEKLTTHSHSLQIGFSKKIVSRISKLFHIWLNLEIREWASSNCAAVARKEQWTMTKAGTFAENAYFEELTPHQEQPVACSKATWLWYHFWRRQSPRWRRCARVRTKVKASSSVVAEGYAKGVRRSFPGLWIRIRPCKLEQPRKCPKTMMHLTPFSIFCAYSYSTMSFFSMLISDFMGKQ